MEHFGPAPLLPKPLRIALVLSLLRSEIERHPSLGHDTEGHLTRRDLQLLGQLRDLRRTLCRQSSAELRLHLRRQVRGTDTFSVARSLLKLAPPERASTLHAALRALRTYELRPLEGWPPATPWEGGPEHATRWG